MLIGEIFGKGYIMLLYYKIGVLSIYNISMMTRYGFLHHINWFYVKEKPVIADFLQTSVLFS